MKRLYRYFFLVLVLLSFQVKAQGDSSPEQTDENKIRAYQIAFISKELNLSPEQAEKFWPLYNEYSQKMRQNQQQIREMRKSVDPTNATEEQKRQIVEMGLQMKQKQVDLEREYTQQMLRVINTNQLMSLRKAEDEFKKILLERVKERNSQQQKLQNQRNLNERRLNNQKNN